MIRSLPASPDLNKLKREAKTLLKAIRCGDVDLSEFDDGPPLKPESAKLSDAQWVLARSYGFESWTALRQHVEVVRGLSQTLPGIVATKASLRKAAREDDAAAIQSILIQDRALLKDWKPLMDACYHGHVEAIEALAEAGADVNMQSTSNWRHRPLHRVIEYKKTYPRVERHEEAVRILLEYGADPMLRGCHGDVTALQLAATGETRFVPVLVDAIREQHGALDIFHAAVVGDLPRVKALLEDDPALASARDDIGRTALMYAGWSQLHKDSQEKSEELCAIARLLIEHGADVHSSRLYEGKWPVPVLYYPTGGSNHPTFARIILEAGASIRDGESLYHSVENMYDDCLNLLASYASPEDLAEEATSILHSHIHWGIYRGVKWLLEHGANPNATFGEDGTTALHEAASRGANDRILDLLIQHGANLKTLDQHGQTPLDLARTKQKERVVNFLQKAGKS